MEKNLSEQLKNYNVKVNLYDFNYNMKEFKINEEKKQIIIVAKDKNNNMCFPSRFDIGDPVKIKVNDKELKGHIRVVIFTKGKVRYSVRVTENDIDTTFHNIDSVFIVPDEDGEKIELDFDNYS